MWLICLSQKFAEYRWYTFLLSPIQPITAAAVLVMKCHLRFGMAKCADKKEINTLNQSRRSRQLCFKLFTWFAFCLSWLSPWFCLSFRGFVFHSIAGEILRLVKYYDTCVTALFSAVRRICLFIITAILVQSTNILLCVTLHAKSFCFTDSLSSLASTTPEFQYVLDP